MRVPRVPSLQHFARLSDNDAQKIFFKLKDVAENPPRISYNSAKSISRDHLIFGTSAEDVMRAAELVKGPRKREAVKNALIAFLRYAEEVESRRYIDIETRYYAIGRHLLVPVNPFLFGVGATGPVLLWPSYWSKLNLTEMQLAIFGTLLDITFFNSADFSGVDLEMIDLGKPPGMLVRDFRILTTKDLPIMTEAELKRYTDAFAEGYHLLRDVVVRDRGKESHQPSASTPLFLDNPF